jgi:hypothetical protein
LRPHHLPSPARAALTPPCALCRTQQRDGRTGTGFR